MILFLAHRDATYTMQIHQASWAGALRHRIQVYSYDRLAHYRELPVATVIFSDLERLTPAQLELAQTIWQRFRQSGEKVCLLNEPARTMRRAELLRTLHAEGRNPFAVYRVSDDLTRVKFPVLVRSENDHRNLCDLLHNTSELTAALGKLLAEGVSRDELLIVEYCDTADAQGVFRKYSAFRLGKHLIARHLLLSRKWMLKSPDIVDDAAVAEEEAYLTDHPHETELNEIFDLARCDYGRIDYSMLDGRVVTWEINTNPMIGVEPWKTAPGRLPSQARFTRRFNELLASMEMQPNGRAVPLNIPSSLLQKLGVRRRDRALRRLGMALRKLGALSPWREALRAAS